MLRLIWSVSHGKVVMTISAPYFTILGRQIPLYGISFYIGIFFAALVALLICKRKNIPGYEIAYSGVYAMIGAVVGAKLLFILVSFRQIITENIPIEAIIKGGFVFYGGLIGGILGIFIYTKQFRMRIDAFFEIYATVLPLGHAFGRIGCLFAGCCYGIPHHGKFSCTYLTSIGNTPINVPLLPIQLIESIGLLLIFILLLIVYLRTGVKTGKTATLYCVFYPILRFVLEFFRGDTERGGIGLLSTSQWVSLLVFASAIACLIRRKQKKKANITQ